ncbi:hypothetical protein [Paenibacillus nasutitermitis]|uniref:Uncharacterized protein n=1 Tax=Paenibacillus nasutitermitis TaxID=1652958 RepID=A0A916ZFR1_9BACL|nr:hypothetical protein [Paenibacillus nasutitermitis]GGD94804.1 hypothetical protein GCM10010911_61860 [Paenibacillus nasutitermitis]
MYGYDTTVGNPGGPASLVANSGFESGLWEPRTSVALDTAVKYSGNQSAGLTSGNIAQWMSSAIAEIELGKKYSVSMRLKTEGISAPDGVKVELMQVDVNGNDIDLYGARGAILQRAEPRIGRDIRSTISLFWPPV